MKSLSTLSLALIVTLAFSTIHSTIAVAVPHPSSNDNDATISTAATKARAGFFESLQSSSTPNSGNHATSASNPLIKKFIIPNETGPERWSCIYMSKSITSSSQGTSITIGKSSKKPFSCGELISRETNLNYGRYSVDMIPTNIKGHVSGFFLIAPNGASEIDIELTGINSTVGWMNVWKDGKQNPIKIPLGFDASKGWHTYTIEWRKEFLAWYVDGKQVHKRSDVATLDPRKNLYKLALNSWTNAVENDGGWAGRFNLPSGGKEVKTQFRNLRYTP